MKMYCIFILLNKLRQRFSMRFKIKIQSVFADSADLLFVQLATEVHLSPQTVPFSKVLSEDTTFWVAIVVFSTSVRI